MMTERAREFSWGAIRGSRVFLNSLEPLKGPNWAGFRCELATVGIKDLDEAFVASKGSWKRLVFIPQVNEHQLARAMARPEYEEAKHDLSKLRELLIDVRNHNGY